MKSKDQLILEEQYNLVRENEITKFDKLNALRKLSQERVYRVGAFINTEFYYEKDAWTPFKYKKGVEYCPNIAAIDINQVQEKLIKYVKSLPIPEGCKVHYLRDKWLEDYIDDKRDMTLYERTIFQTGQDGDGMSPGKGEVTHTTTYVAIGEESPYYTKNFLYDTDFNEMIRRWIQPF